jgi:hypothetical protein
MINSKSSWQLYINTITDFLNIIHRPIFFFASGPEMGGQLYRLGPTDLRTEADTNLRNLNLKKKKGWCLMFRKSINCVIISATYS